MADAGDVFDFATFGEVIPLAADLSNAIIATCKGPHAGFVTPPPYVPSPPPAIPTPVAKSQIWDPVWKTSTIIPNQEHQVGPLQHGIIDKTDETTGPTGDFWPKWKYVEEKDGAPSQQPFQDALAGGGQSTTVVPWDHTAAAAINYTNEALPVNYNNSLPANNTWIQLDFESTRSVPTWA